VDKHTGARFKSFPTRAEAEQAFAHGGYASIPAKTPNTQKASTPRGERCAADPSQQFDVSIYCDGAYEPNPGSAGSGIVVYRAGELAQLWFGLYNPMGTNNTAELNALYHALRMAEAEIKTTSPPTSALKATNSPTAWPCSVRSVKKKNCDRIRGK
jgi:ribonuclease HI